MQYSCCLIVNEPQGDKEVEKALKEGDAEAEQTMKAEDKADKDFVAGDEEAGAEVEEAEAGL